MGSEEPRPSGGDTALDSSSERRLHLERGRAGGVRLSDVDYTSRLTFREILDIMPSGEDRWSAPSPARHAPRLYGGQLAAQALAVAQSTVEDGRTPNSLHSYFLRGGQPDAPLELVVERIRDGQAFSTRRVTAVQDGTAIMTLIASFHIPEVSNDWQIDIPRMIVPEEGHEGKAPDGFRAFWAASPCEVRLAPSASGDQPPHPVWVRAVERLDPAAIVDACALIYITDMNLVASARPPQDRSPIIAISVDHAVWLHRPTDMTQWHRLSVHPISNSNARGLVFGSVHSADGTLVASIAQEALLRPVDPEGSA